MSKKSCTKSVLGLTNMPKKYQAGKPTRNIYTSAWNWSNTEFNINFKWSIGFECPHPVIFSPFRILTICPNYKCYGNILKKTTMTFAFKMLKHVSFRAFFLSLLLLFHLSQNSSVVSPTYFLLQDLLVRR